MEVPGGVKRKRDDDEEEKHVYGDRPNEASDDPITIEKYNPNWPFEFRSEAAAIRSAISSDLLEASCSENIVHVGSTSIEGLSAKPIIDIAIIVKSLEPFVSGRIGCEALMRLGYEQRGESGIADRLYFRRGAPVKYHVHVELLHGENTQRHLNFRAYLRSHPEEAKLYGDFKTSIESCFRNDRQGYRKCKFYFCEAILTRAQKWLKSQSDSFDLTADTEANSAMSCPVPILHNIPTGRCVSSVQELSLEDYAGEVACEIHRRAIQEESFTSNILQQAVQLLSSASTTSGGYSARFHKFDMRVKSVDSIRRKLLLNPDRLEKLLAAETLQREIFRAGRLADGCPLLFEMNPILYDSLRYTIIFSTENYSNGVTDIDNLLFQNGFSKFRAFSYWPVTPERELRREASGERTHIALHGFYVNNRGFVFELQFYTEESLVVNLETRALYETIRAETDPEKCRVMQNELKEANKKIPIPPNVAHIDASLSSFPAEFDSFHGKPAAKILSKALLLRRLSEI